MHLWGAPKFEIDITNFMIILYYSIFFHISLAKVKASSSFWSRVSEVHLMSAPRIMHGITNQSIQKFLLLLWYLLFSRKTTCGAVKKTSFDHSLTTFNYPSTHSYNVKSISKHVFFFKYFQLNIDNTDRINFSCCVGQLHFFVFCCLKIHKKRFWPLFESTYKREFYFKYL